MTEQNGIGRGIVTTASSVPGGDACFYERRDYERLLRQLRELEQEYFAAQGILAELERELTYREGVIEHQIDRMIAEVIEPLERMWDDLSDLAKEKVRILKDLIQGRPPIGDDISDYDAIVDTCVSLLSLVGGYVRLGLRLAAYMVALRMYRHISVMHARQKHRVESLKQEVERLRELVQEARQVLINCQELYGVCAACWERLRREDLIRCKGCGADFCPRDFSEAIEAYELKHGNANVPG